MIELTEKVRKRFEIQLKKIWVGSSELKKSRPRLNQIHYSDNGHIEITNSMVGVRLSDVHDKPDSDNMFPDMDDIFKTPGTDKIIEFKMKELKDLEDHLNILYKNKIEVVKIKMNADGIHLENGASKTNEPFEHHPFVESGIKVKLDLKDEWNIAVNPRFLHDALMMFRLIGVNDLELHYQSELRPLHLVSDNLHYLIVPIRTGG